jgi:hypothetical protein
VSPGAKSTHSRDCIKKNSTTFDPKYLSLIDVARAMSRYTIGRDVNGSDQMGFCLYHSIFFVGFGSELIITGGGFKNG